MDRKQILTAATKEVCEDRNREHGEPENTFPMIAKFWSTYLGVEVKPYDVAEMMVLFKTARFKANPSNPDNCVDTAGYTACAGGLVDYEPS